MAGGGALLNLGGHGFDMAASLPVSKPKCCPLVFVFSAPAGAARAKHFGDARPRMNKTKAGSVTLRGLVIHRRRMVRS